MKNRKNTLKIEKDDAAILNVLQEAIPLCPRPFKHIGDKLGLSEDEVINRLNKMKEGGYIRHIGAVFGSSKIGFTSTLVTMKVPENKLTEVVPVINEYPGVTHNYLRESEYNLWFTLTAQSPEHIDMILKEISAKTGIKGVLNLPAIYTFKIKVAFDISPFATPDGIKT